MVLELMSDDRLKVLLEKEDLKQYDLSFVTIDYRNKKTKEVFWQVINIARKKTGFNPQGSKLLIEAYPEHDGNVLLYVTKLGEKERKSNSFVFGFDNLDAVLDSLSLFKKTDIRTYGFNLYKMENRFYLAFYTDCETDELMPLFLDLNEYGDEIKTPNKRSYLDEHGSIFVENLKIPS